MKQSLFAIAIVGSAIIAPPVPATTFPTLTTIYVASSVRDSGGAQDVGVATSFVCTNASGVNVSIRVLVLDSNGSVAGSIIDNDVPHGNSQAFSTHGTAMFSDFFVSPGISVNAGGAVIESTESGVFCHAMIIDA